MTSVILGVVALVKESRQPEEYGGKGMAITGIVLSGVSILIMPVVANGCSKMELGTEVQLMVTGGIIILAVALDHLRQRKTR